MTGVDESVVSNLSKHAVYVSRARSFLEVEHAVVSVHAHAHA